MARSRSRGRSKITSFGFSPGRGLAGKYDIVARLGGGWEGEVYLVRERGTGIERAAKFFFPQRNPGNRTLNLYARRLHKLRDCRILIQYHTQETVTFRKRKVAFLVSDYVRGEILADFLRRQPGRRLDAFQALHLLHALAEGIEQIHDRREYHGDIHTDNVIVRRRGLGFEVKLVDMYYWGPQRRSLIQEDVLNLVRLFYDTLGGQAHYRQQPIEVKGIVRGLRRDLILSRFRTAGELRAHLETLPWQSR
jgi:hypothetical protein